MSILYVHHEVNILLIYTLISSFHPLLLESRPMTSHHVIYYVTAVICLFIAQQKRKKKKKIRKGKIKSKKIDKRKKS